jgi:hypothetical protein
MQEVLNRWLFAKELLPQTRSFRYFFRFPDLHADDCGSIWGRSCSCVSSDHHHGTFLG